MAEIVEQSRQPITKTQILHRTNLTWTMDSEYISLLLSRGLLEIHRSKTKYAATQKGLQFAEKCKEIEELLSQD